MASRDLDARLRDAVSALVEPELVAAWLFGSHAEHRAHRESDVDLGVLFRFAPQTDAASRFEAALRIHAELAPAIGRTSLDLVVLNDAPPGLAAAIVTRGVPLVVHDPEREHEFRRTVQLRAADLQPFLRRTRALKREALAR
jgi:hypothetical protein